MNKHILQWLKDELESYGDPQQLTISWDDLDSIWQHVERQTNIKLK